MGSSHIGSILFGRKKEPNLKTLEQIEGLLGGNQSSDYKMYINEGQEDQMEIFYYRSSPVKTALTYLGFVLTLGILRLVYHWIPHLYLFSTSVSCKIGDADKILIVELFNGKHKVYHVKPLRMLTPEQVAGMDLDGSALDRPNNAPNLGFPPSMSVHFERGLFRDVDKLLMFSVKKVTYVFETETQRFIKLCGLDSAISCDIFHQYQPLSASESFMRRVVYGPNVILVKESSISTLLFLEVLNPFYIFQLFSFILWFSDEYYYYAAAIMFMSAFGIVMSVRQTRRNQRNLKSTVHSSDVCTVLRRTPKTAEFNELNDSGFTEEAVSTNLLVPGDIIEIPSHGCIMHCDAVLLTGNCILNEAMLTGESVPVTKTGVPNFPNLIYDPKEHARHTLFCGTHVIQTRYFNNEKVLALVIRTGYMTSKGNLVRSILYPPPVDFRFEKDSYKFIGVLSGFALVGFLYTLVTKIMRGVLLRDIIFQALDLVTIVVPPALPAAMTVGSLFAQVALRKKNIFCISPRTINVSGSINCVCFDKTGTLTEDGLDLLCVVPTKEGSFVSPVSNVETMQFDTFLYGLVCCHSLNIIDNQIVGDPLDLKMFESTKWALEEMSNLAENNKFNVLFPTVFKPPKNRSGPNQNLSEDPQIGILREFPFSSSSQRMGVIVRRLNGAHFEYYCKGSPEMILNFVKPETVPANFHEILESYTQEGYRVIAMAHKELRLGYTKVQKVQREVIENELNFLGLIVLENRLKPETFPSIQDLNEAKIRVIMVTGDNILTAISVAKDCDIVLPSQTIITVNSDNSSPPNLYYTLTNTKDRGKAPKDLSVMSNSVSVASLETLESQLQTASLGVTRHSNGAALRPDGLMNNYRFAMTGRTWAVIKEHYPELMPRICTRGTVFARMAPDQKQQLVQELQGLGYYVAMCGDGANDCGALKAANTGISLSEAESSVASPFTSKNPNITCVLEVIREGRSALVTSFGIFKYMASYSLCQFVAVLILYSIESNLTDTQFLYSDLCIISSVAFFFGRTESYPGKLHRHAPLSGLVSLSQIASLTIHTCLIAIFQTAAFFHLKAQPWFVPFVKTSDDVSCWENYTIYTISSFQYIILAIVFSKGYPYRKSIFTNRGFILCTLAVLIISTYLALYPAPGLQSYMGLVMPATIWFRFYILGYAAANFLSSIFVEYVIIEQLLLKKLRFKFHNVDNSKKKYLAIERDLNKDRKWPVLTSDFKDAASPLSPAPECHAEIVIEKENKFDKNHVLNKLFDNVGSSPNSAFTTPTHMLVTPNHQYSTPSHQMPSPQRQHETGYFSRDSFEFCPSDVSSPTKSDTFKSVSNNRSSYDMASSQLNIPDIPFDDASVTIMESPTKSINISMGNGDLAVNYGGFNAFGQGKSPSGEQNGENLRLELNNFDINR